MSPAIWPTLRVTEAFGADADRAGGPSAVADRGDGLDAYLLVELRANEDLLRLDGHSPTAWQARTRANLQGGDAPTC